jgi:uncharacterized membrane protein
VTLYVLLKFVHVLLAIVAIGFNASYGIWLARAGREPEHALHVLRGIKILDDRFANPAYGLLLITGVGLVFMGQIPFSTFWIASAIVLFVIVVIVAAAIYTPTLRRQIATLESQGATSEEYRRLSSRGRTLGIVLAVLVVAIEFLMVTKPTL